MYDQKELIYKFECNEKYWNTKCANLEENIFERIQENKDLQAKVSRLMHGVEAKNQEIVDLNSKNIQLKSKKDKKEDLVETLQIRVESLLKENGESTKELSLRIEEISRLKETLSSAENRISELKAVIRENEKNLNDLHSKSIENSNMNLLRAEELQRKYDELQKTMERKIDENRKIAEKNHELVDLIQEWERKFDERVNEALKAEEGKLRRKEAENAKFLEEIDSKYGKQIEDSEEKFKVNMDLLEEEFKKVLLENNEKFKQLKVAYDEKYKNELEMKQFLKLTVAKNSDMERIIEEQTELLKKLKKEYTDVFSEKESLSKNVILLFQISYCFIYYKG